METFAALSMATTLTFDHPCNYLAIIVPSHMFFFNVRLLYDTHVPAFNTN